MMPPKLLALVILVVSFNGMINFEVMPMKFE